MDLGGILGIVAAGLLVALAAVVFGIGIFAVCMILLARPWDSNTKRTHQWSVIAPYPAFWGASWAIRVAEYVVSLKPGTLRAAELAILYIQSQV